MIGHKYFGSGMIFSIIVKIYKYLKTLNLLLIML